jgi:hypothetical protein
MEVEVVARDHGPEIKHRCEVEIDVERGELAAVNAAELLRCGLTKFRRTVGLTA